MFSKVFIAAVTTAVSESLSLRQRMKLSTNLQAQCPDIHDNDPHFQGEKKYLGKGAFGDVSLYSTGLGNFAVKTASVDKKKYALAEVTNLEIISGIVGNSIGSQCTFEEEATCLMRYDGCGQFSNGTIAIFLEYVDGPGDLWSFVQSEEWKNMNPSTKHLYVRAFAGEMIAGVHFLHKNNIVHQDLKPENFVLQKNVISEGMSGDCLSIKTVDFGMLRVCPNKICPCDPLGGTPDYMPPEVVSASILSKKLKEFNEIVKGQSSVVNDNMPTIQSQCQQSDFALVAARDVYAIGRSVLDITGASSADNIADERLREFVIALTQKNPICRPTLEEIENGEALPDLQNKRDGENCTQMDMKKLQELVRVSPSETAVLPSKSASVRRSSTRSPHEISQRATAKQSQRGSSQSPS